MGRNYLDFVHESHWRSSYFLAWKLSLFYLISWLIKRCQCFQNLSLILENVLAINLSNILSGTLKCLTNFLLVFIGLQELVSLCIIHIMWIMHIMYPHYAYCALKMSIKKVYVDYASTPFVNFFSFYKSIWWKSTGNTNNINSCIKIQNLCYIDTEKYMQILYITFFHFFTGKSENPVSWKQPAEQQFHFERVFLIPILNKMTIYFFNFFICM